MARDLIDQYREIHSRQRYGDTSIKNLPHLLPLVDELRPETVVDFGCGQSRLIDELSRLTGARGTRYDPSIPAYAEKPAGTFDLLVNIDVLEHVPEEEVDALIGEMAGMAPNAIIVIDTGPAVQILPDGRNAHVTQQPADWWAERLSRHYAHIEPIRVRSRRRAAFKTWPTPTGGRLRRAWLYGREEIRYRLAKLTR